MKSLLIPITIFAISVCLAVPGQARSTINAGRLIRPFPTFANGSRSGSEKTVTYQVAKGYFVKNTVKQPLNDSKIVSQQQFDALFGMAAVMGKDGRPTPIDFDQQYVIAVVVPASDRRVSLTPISLKKDRKGQLVFAYRRQTGDKQSYTSSAALLIIVAKSVTGRVILTEKS